MVLSTRAWVALAAITAAGVMMIQTALAAPEGTRPGWGGTNPKSQGNSVGDQNHIHTGPPGQTVVPPTE